MVFWNMRCWLTRACRRMGWTWLENLSSGRPEGRGAALTLVVRYYYLACTYIRSPILRSCCRQARLPYTPPINRWLAQSKNWLSSNLSINFEPSRSKWADELSKGCHHINDPGSGHIEANIRVSLPHCYFTKLNLKKWDHSNFVFQNC